MGNKRHTSHPTAKSKPSLGNYFVFGPYFKKHSGERTKLNLNNVTADELLNTIPNFGNRMVREFFEYRPYISIQQFRREIGKYVDQTEVAEYEQYVYVPIDVDNADAETLKQLPGVDDTIAADLMAARPCLRLFLLILSGLICIGAIVELWLTEHTESWLQLLPFALCGIGCLTILLVLIRPQRGTLLALRVVMTGVALGGLFGIYEHIEHNLAFELEIRPNAVVSDVLMDALGGVNPLLAPGILALGAILAIAATYYHPMLEE